MEDDLTEKLIMIVPSGSKRCPGCEEIVFAQTLIHICGDENSKNRIDHIVCSKCLYELYIINGEVIQPIGDKYCACRKPIYE